MRKSALIVAPKSLAELVQLEKALLSVGFDTLRVSSVKDALFRVGTEIFSVVICVDSDGGAFQREFASAIRETPLGAVTPLVVVSSADESPDRAGLTSILDQYFSVHTDPSLLAEFCNETHTLRHTKPKKASLGRISLPQVLYHVCQCRMNGAVVVEKGEERGLIYLEGGYVTFASSNRDENRFGEFLVQQGIISRNDFVRATEILEKTGRRFGNILVEEGVLKPQVLQTLIQSQVKHNIYAVFDWIEGEYYILPEEKSCQSDPVARFDVAALVLEGVRFKFGERRLEEEFKPFDQKVSLAIPMLEAQKSVHLGKNENDFLRLIGSGRPLRELLTLNSFTRLEALKLLYAFKILGLLAFERGAFPVSTEMPGFQERAKVVTELFKEKPRGLEKRDTAEPREAPVPARLVRRKPRYRDLLTGAFAVSAFVSIVTFIDQRSVRDGQSSQVREPEPSPIATQVEVPIAVSAVPAIPVVSSTPVVEVVTPEPDMVALKRLQDAAEKSAEKANQVEQLMKEGVELRSQRRLDAALTAYRKALALEPKNSQALLAEGDVLFDLERITEARVVFERVAKLDPLNPKPYLTLGTIFLIQNERQKAAASLRKYLSVVERTPANQSRILETEKILRTLQNTK